MSDSEIEVLSEKSDACPSNCQGPRNESLLLLTYCEQCGKVYETYKMKCGYCEWKKTWNPPVWSEKEDKRCSNCEISLTNKRRHYHQKTDEPVCGTCYKYYWKHKTDRNIDKRRGKKNDIGDKCSHCSKDVGDQQRRFETYRDASSNLICRNCQTLMLMKKKGNVTDPPEADGISQTTCSKCFKELTNNNEQRRYDQFKNRICQRCYSRFCYLRRKTEIRQQIFDLRNFLANKFAELLKEEERIGKSVGVHPFSLRAILLRKPNVIVVKVKRAVKPRIKPPRPPKAPKSPKVKKQKPKKEEKTRTKDSFKFGMKYFALQRILNPTPTGQNANVEKRIPFKIEIEESDGSECSEYVSDEEPDFENFNLNPSNPGSIGDTFHHWEPEFEDISYGDSPLAMGSKPPNIGDLDDGATSVDFFGNTPYSPGERSLGEKSPGIFDFLDYGSPQGQAGPEGQKPMDSPLLIFDYLCEDSLLMDGLETYEVLEQENPEYFSLEGSSFMAATVEAMELDFVDTVATESSSQLKNIGITSGSMEIPSPFDPINPSTMPVVAMGDSTVTFDAMEKLEKSTVRECFSDHQEDSMVFENRVDDSDDSGSSKTSHLVEPITIECSETNLSGSPVLANPMEQLERPTTHDNITNNHDPMTGPMAEPTTPMEPLKMSNQDPKKKDYPLLRALLSTKPKINARASKVKAMVSRIDPTQESRTNSNKISKIDLTETSRIHPTETSRIHPTQTPRINPTKISSINPTQKPMRKPIAKRKPPKTQQKRTSLVKPLKPITIQTGSPLLRALLTAKSSRYTGVADDEGQGSKAPANANGLEESLVKSPVDGPKVQETPVEGKHGHGSQKCLENYAKDQNIPESPDNVFRLGDHESPGPASTLETFNRQGLSPIENPNRSSQSPSFPVDFDPELSAFKLFTSGTSRMPDFLEQNLMDHVLELDHEEVVEQTQNSTFPADFDPEHSAFHLFNSGSSRMPALLHGALMDVALEVVHEEEVYAE